MTERELQKGVIDMARVFGWRVAHFRPARVMRNGKEIYETPVDADGKGFPDLVLVKPPRLLFVELKSDKGRKTLDQDIWLGYLSRCPGVRVHLWKPADWDSGLIEEELRA